MAGNVGKSSKVLEVDSSNPMSASPKAPRIVSFSKNCGVADDHITNDKALTLTGTADANSIAKVFDGGKKIGTTHSSKDGSWSSDIGDLADGKHSYTSTAVDAAGNASAASSAKAVSIIDAPPSREIDSTD